MKGDYQFEDCQVERRKENAMRVVQLDCKLSLYLVLHSVIVFVPKDSPVNALPDLVPLVLSLLLSHLELLGVVKRKIKRRISIEVYMKFVLTFLLPLHPKQVGNLFVHLDRQEECSPNPS